MDIQNCTAAELKKARPKNGFECHVEKDQQGGCGVWAYPVEVSDWSWLRSVEVEGYDNELGPCYWRATSRCFYNTILHRGEIYLLICANGSFQSSAAAELAVRRHLEERSEQQR
jgi:hypothetical protein